MKNLFCFLAVVWLFTGCAVHYSAISTGNGFTTNVELNKKNFKVIEYVEGSAESFYLAGVFGGAKHQSLLESAKRDLMQKANLPGTSRALAYVTFSERYSFVVIGVKRKILVSGYVVEFTE